MNKQKVIMFLKRELRWLIPKIIILVVVNFVIFSLHLRDFIPANIYSLLTKGWGAVYILFAAVLINRYLIDYIGKLVNKLFHHYQEDESIRRGLKRRTNLFTSLFKYGVYLIAFLLVLDLFINLGAIWDFLGQSFILIVSFFVGMMTSSTLGNLIAYEALKQADIVSKNEVIKTKDNLFGEVVSRGAFFTRIRTPNKEIVSISNLDLTNNLVKNYSREIPLIVDVSLGLGYDVKKDVAKKLLLEAAEKTEGVLQSPQSFVLLLELGDFTITYKLNAYIDQPHNLVIIKSRLIENIIDTFDQNKIEILSPAYYKRV